MRARAHPLRVFRRSKVAVQMLCGAAGIFESEGWGTDKTLAFNPRESAGQVIEESIGDGL
jgi:hypothetical protein